MLAAGTTLGPYTILAPLGSGGMGEVYRARDPRLAREVAIKLVRTDLARDPQHYRRFEQEARAAGGLNHPNVCTIHDVGTFEGAPFVVMELLEGESLRAKLRSGPLALRTALEYAAQAARGVAAAHAKGIVHRDLKPENLFVTTDGRVKVLDFGLAKLAEQQAPAAASATTVSVALTEEGAILGTSGYMAPEQLRAAAVDARTDVFALGAIVHELVGGKPAFAGGTFVETASAVLHDEPAALSTLRADVPAALDVVVSRCLAKEPAQRWANAGELASALESVASGATSTSRPASGARPRTGRAWAAAALLVVAVAAVIALGLNGWTLSRNSPPPAMKAWILVAEFDGPPGDSTLAPAARSLLSAALDQSRIAVTVPQDQIVEALQAAGKPASARVGPALAKELAYRSAVRAVLEGTIGRLGTGYSIVLRLVDADTVRVLFMASATARNDDALIPELGELAKQLRRGLGEHREELQATRPMTLVATPSFEAYRLYADAVRRQDAGEAISDVVALCRQALALDPDFSMAWGRIAYNLNRQDSYDSARVCLERALRRLDRLTAVQRQVLEIRRADLEGDVSGALAATERLVRQDPANVFVLRGSHDQLINWGRYEQALEWTRRAMQLSPFGPTENMRLDEITDLSALGRLDEARAVQRQLKGNYKAWHLLWIELQASQFARAESIATAHLDAPELAADLPGAYLNPLSFAQAGRGALQAAVATNLQLEEIVRTRPEYAGERRGRELATLRRNHIEFALIGRGATAMPQEAWDGDTSTFALLTRGLRAAFAGDRAAARRIAAIARQRPKRELADHAIELIEAREALAAGRIDDAISTLRPLTREESWNRPGLCMAGARWTLADAFEQAGRADSAAAYLEVLAGPTISIWEQPYVSQRLALLYSRTGRVADAERHLAAVERAWDRADPAVRRMLEDARAAVLAARARAKR